MSPQQRKSEEAASREGLSVTAWLVRAVTAALEPGSWSRDAGRGQQVGRHFTGWVH